MSNILYFPALTVRESECKGLGKLAGPTKDKMFPIVRVQAWPRKKAGFESYVQRSLLKLKDAFDDRPLALDLATPRLDLDSDIKKDGASEISLLHNPSGGFQAWTELLTETNYTPVYQWTIDPATAVTQWIKLASLGRSIVLRFRRSQRWNMQALSAIPQSLIEGTSVLAIFDCEQISRSEDLTLIAFDVQNVILAHLQRLQSANVTTVVMGSSFPAEFASIHPEYAKMDILERQIFNLLEKSPPLLAAGIAILYGDHASVYATSKPPAFRGLPRVDFPSKLTWAYHRRKEVNGYKIAAEMVLKEKEWRNDFAWWGAQEIRRAAGGNLKGLNSGAPWTAIRINNHLHQQAYFHEGIAPIEEEWED